MPPPSPMRFGEILTENTGSHHSMEACTSPALSVTNEIGFSPGVAAGPKQLTSHREVLRPEPIGERPKLGLLFAWVPQPRTMRGIGRISGSCDKSHVSVTIKHKVWKPTGSYMSLQLTPKPTPTNFPQLHSNLPSCSSGHSAATSKAQQHGSYVGACVWTQTSLSLLLHGGAPASTGESSS